jgi:hypothetical protein
LVLYPIEKGIEDRDKTGLSGLSLNVNRPPAVRVNFISGEYDGAIKGVRVERPLSILHSCMESSRWRKVFFL